MMVYIVYRNDYKGEDAIELVFTTKEAAQDYCDKANKLTFDKPYNVLPHKVEPE